MSETATIKIPRWGNEALSQVIDEGLVTLMQLGHVEEEKVQANDLQYIYTVAGALAGTMCSMPATQRAMQVAHPGFTAQQNFEELVRVIGKAFMIDEDRLLKLLAPAPAPVEASPQVPSFPPGSVN